MTAHRGYKGVAPNPGPTRRRNPSKSLLRRALIRLRKAGLTQHVENRGTNSSTPPLSSEESCELLYRIRTLHLRKAQPVVLMPRRRERQHVDLAVIKIDLKFLMDRLSKLPTRQELALRPLYIIARELRARDRLDRTVPTRLPIALSLHRVVSSPQSPVAVHVLRRWRQRVTHRFRSDLGARGKRA